jgi:tRNA nucleotidyltransferase (CCA-adding enzyme)
VKIHARLPRSFDVLTDIFSACGIALYLVGGYVRNLVLGLPGGDFDICSAARPETAAAIVREAGLSVTEKALELGTIEIRVDLDGARHRFEHTTFRRDYYPPGGAHRPYRVEFTEDIREDARRRDFTAGARYLDLKSRELLDPTGHGLEDVRARVLRAAAEDPDVTIRDDGLRIMRMARFAAELGFDVAPDLLECAARRAALLDDISPERKRDELMKILMADTKYPVLNVWDAPLRGLNILLEIGALKYVLPRLCAGDGVEQSGLYHRYDVLRHGIHACAAAPPDPVLRLAALLHDIGKPAALTETGKFYGHEKLGEALAREEMESLRFDNRTRDDVLPLVRYHMFDLEGKAKPKTIRRRAVMLGRETFERLIALRRADVVGSGWPVQRVASADNWQRELDNMLAEGVPWTVAELKVTGHDISQWLGIPPSPMVGEILKALHRECVMNPKRNSREALKKSALALGKRLILN